MSRAFVKEDQVAENLPSRPISEHPNYVTENGLRLIEAALEAARREHGEAQASGDRDALARASRDLHYWSARRATANVVASTPNTVVVQFGSVVTILRDDGREQTFRIVGEDEADPGNGTISHVSPLARSLLGKSIGAVIRAGRGEAEIKRIE